MVHFVTADMPLEKSGLIKFILISIFQPLQIESIEDAHEVADD